MKTSTGILLLLLLLIYSLSACSMITSTVPQSTETIIPAPTEVVVIPTFPTVTQGKGVVCGSLLDENTGFPPEATLFLSKNISAGRDDVPAMMSFSYQTNPRSEMNEHGHFCFEDVDPGIYALTLWTPPGNTEFIESEDGQDYLWIEVQPDSVIDLGHLSQ